MATLSLDQLGIAIKEKRAGRSIREVADEIGISSATLSRIETGRQPNLDTFSKICRWLNISPADILNYNPEDNSADQKKSGFNKAYSVHLRADKNLQSETAKRLGEMLIAAQKMFNDE